MLLLWWAATDTLLHGKPLNSNVALCLCRFRRESSSEFGNFLFIYLFLLISNFCLNFLLMIPSVLLNRISPRLYKRLNSDLQFYLTQAKHPSTRPLKFEDLSLANQDMPIKYVTVWKASNLLPAILFFCSNSNFTHYPTFWGVSR